MKITEKERMMAQREEPHEIVVEEVAPGVALTAPTESIGSLLRMAVAQNLDVEKLEKLIALKERMEDRDAVKQFAAAMAEFQKRCPAITRGKLVDYVTKTGVRIHYRHAELRDIQVEINSICAELGFSYSWDNTVEGRTLKTICTAWHVAGHSRSATFVGPIDNPNPGMSEAQKYGGALTFGERYSLIQVFGLVTADPDTDGEGAASADRTPITKDEADLLAELAEAAKIKVERVLKKAKVERLEDIRATDYPGIKAALEARIKELRAKGEVA